MLPTTATVSLAFPYRMPSAFRGVFELTNRVIPFQGPVTGFVKSKPMWLL